MRNERNADLQLDFAVELHDRSGFGSSEINEHVGENQVKRRICAGPQT